MSSRRLNPLDTALALVAVGALLLEGRLRHSGAFSPGFYALAAGSAAPLVWRMRRPLTSLVCVGVGAIVCAAVFDASWAATGMVALELYTVALLGDRVRSLLVGAIVAVIVSIASVLIEGGIDVAEVAIRVPLVFAALAVGDTLRSRGDLRAAARERAEREEHERRAEMRRRTTDERMRIARELHDTLGHSLVAINVRAGVALDLARAQEGVDALEDIKRVSATALRDLRSTLRLLRDEDDEAPTAPAYDLDALPGLVARARAAGLDATVRVELGGAVISSAVGGAAFRIVQEALTNVLRHADASNAYVDVRTARGALDVAISDNGQAGGDESDPGFGLRGMTERAAALGGRVEAGPRIEGGWRVHATLPLTGDGRP